MSMGENDIEKLEETLKKEIVEDDKKYDEEKKQSKKLEELQELETRMVEGKESKKKFNPGKFNLKIAVGVGCVTISIILLFIFGT